MRTNTSGDVQDNSWVCEERKKLNFTKVSYEDCHWSVSEPVVCWKQYCWGWTG